jgi:geranylgeranyl reductase
MKKNFLEWLKLKKINIAEATYEAFVINCDYQGYKFGDTFLIGDAAGLASGFTGEGIYQALISGEEIAKLILDNSYEPEKLKRIIEISQKHWIAAVKLSRSGIFGEAITNFAGYLLTKTSFQKRIIEAFFM